MSIVIHSAQVSGIDARPISVEVDITPGLHVFTIVGLADKEVQESRERIGAAIKNLGALAPNKKSQRVIVNLAPADVKKEGPAFDLPIALGYLLASGQIIFDPAKKLFLGELGLNGHLRQIPGVLPMALAARESGFEEVIIPKGNGKEAAFVHGIVAREAENLLDVIEHLAGRKELPVMSHSPGILEPQEVAIDFRDIKGQEKAKRALEIAAAGGHNILMSGPPGSGKSILARAAQGILPPLPLSEMLETTKIYSVSGLLTSQDPLVAYPPFRAPHHTSSYAAIIGGGTYPRPGEITLAHNGVLFLDELPEFDRRVLESLRQPLEEKRVAITRSQGTLVFPANFMLIAAQNPCPCGHFRSAENACACSPGAIMKYQKKISGPLRDRIDIHIAVPAVSYEKMEAAGGETSSMVQGRVASARALQQKRFLNLPFSLNSGMGIRDVERVVPLTPSLRNVLKMAHERFHLSARSYHRLLKLSRTIADLDSSPDVNEHHLIEAVQYRPVDDS